MTKPVIRIHPDEPVSVAARTLEHYNIGILPVCGADGRIRGLVSDRDLVTRCIAAGRSPSNTPVRQIMTSQVIWAGADDDVAEAAALMGSRQIRRLPVVENGKLCGMVSLGDLASCREGCPEAAAALADISSHLSRR